MSAGDGGELADGQRALFVGIGVQAFAARRALPVGAAKPRKTSMARLSRTMSLSSRRPTCERTLLLRTVVTWSTIRRQGERSPFRSFGVMGRRMSGASVGSLVNAQIVTESVAPNRSSCTMTAGRGFPA